MCVHCTNKPCHQNQCQWRAMEHVKTVDIARVMIKD